MGLFLPLISLVVYWVLLALVFYIDRYVLKHPRDINAAVVQEENEDTVVHSDPEDDSPVARTVKSGRRLNHSPTTCRPRTPRAHVSFQNAPTGLAAVRETEDIPDLPGSDSSSDDENVVAGSRKSKRC
jgi:hypothetical protein